LILRDSSATATDELFIAIVDGIGALVNRGAVEMITSKLTDLASVVAGLLSSHCISSNDFSTCLAALGETVDSIREIPSPYEMTWDVLAEHAVRSHSISLLTIHGSKGLEYDGVAVVGLNADTLPFFAVVDVQDIEEERRKLFVAATRAAKVLLLASHKAGGKAESRFLNPIRPLVASWQTGG
jgi:superfamily I DNA/RNA helicase